MLPCAMVFLVLALLTSFSSAVTLEAYVTAEAATIAGAEQASTAEAGTMTEPNRKTLLFIHIPKNAGTTIEELGRKAGLRWGKHNDKYNGKSFTGKNRRLSLLGSQHGEDACSFWHVPPKLFPDPNPYNDANSEFFCVVRDPWERLVSEFTWRWSIKGVTHEDIASCDPAGFAIWLDSSLKAFESGHKSEFDCHMLPQNTYIRDSSGHSWCQHILKTDKLTQEFNELMSRWKLNLRMDESDHYNDEDDDPQCNKIQEASLTELFSASAKQRVREIYAEDFALLGDSLLKTSKNARRGLHRKR